MDLVPHGIVSWLSATQIIWHSKLSTAWINKAFTVYLKLLLQANSYTFPECSCNCLFLNAEVLLFLFLFISFLKENILEKMGIGYKNQQEMYKGIVGHLIRDLETPAGEKYFINLT